VLWCLGIIALQLVIASVAAGVIIVAALIAPQAFPSGNEASTENVLHSRPVMIGLGVGFLVFFVALIGFGLLALRLVVGRDWTRRVALRRPSLIQFLFVLAGFPCLAILGNVSYALLRAAGVPSISDLKLTGMEEAIQLFNQWPWAFAVLVIGVGPGIGEELWCRGFLGQGLVGRYGVVVGVLLSSFFFGFIHLDPCQGAMAALMGIFLHFVYLTTRSLWMPMLLHFLNNSVAVFTPRVQWLNDLDLPPAQVPAALYVTAALLLAAVIYGLMASRSRLVGMDGGPPAWQPSYPGVEFPPPGSGTVVERPNPGLLPLLLVAASFTAFVLVCYRIVNPT
jgi:membrane protease YdiL (CAAX protease family)